MRSFTDILTESKKVYEFKIGIAGELPDGCETEMKSCLEKFSVVEVSAGKKTPIQERPLDFPQLQNMEVTYYEVSLNYPTTPQVLEEYIEKCCPCDPNHVIVRNMGDPRANDDYYQNSNEPYEALLDKEELEPGALESTAQNTVAGNRVMDLLKELETVRKERNIDPMEGAPKGESKDIDSKENTKAVIGG